MSYRSNLELQPSNESFTILLNSSKEFTMDEESTLDVHEGFRKLKPFVRKEKFTYRIDCNQTLSTLSELKSKLDKLKEGVKNKSKIIEELDKENSILTIRKKFLHEKLRIKLKKMRKTPRCCCFSNLFD